MARKTKHEDEMRSHYDFSSGERGKYAARYAEGTEVDMLPPNVAMAISGPVDINKAKASRPLDSVSERNGRAKTPPKKGIGS